MTATASFINPQILMQAEKILMNFFGCALTIDQVHLLSEPDRRNMLLRLHLKSTLLDLPASVILKRCSKDREDLNDDDMYSWFARDWAAHEFISKLDLQENMIPRFYGGCNKYGFILIEDLGTQHISLVDALTGCDSDQALTALKRFMKTLAQFHAVTYHKTSQYDQILHKIYPQIDTCKDPVDEFLGELIPVLENVHNLLDLTIDPALITEIKVIIKNTLAPDTFRVLTHGDICPDNVFDFVDLNRFKLIDFEFAQVRSALLDATYLTMSMPTCWCAQSIPQHLITQLEHIYRDEIIKTIPEASCDQSYYAAYTYACGYWVLNTLFLLKDIWNNDKIMSSGPIPITSLWRPDNNYARPRVISRLSAFIDITAENKILPHLTYLSKKILQEIQQLWPYSQLLEYYAAFN